MRPRGDRPSNSIRFVLGAQVQWTCREWYSGLVGPEGWRTLHRKEESMGGMTAPMARGAIKRALNGALDRYPKRRTIDELWEFFDSRCAYSGDLLDRKRREGHADHLVATTAGGTNHASNFVLACGRCNGDEKLGGDWVAFLRRKCAGNRAVFSARRKRILEWVLLQGGVPPRPNMALRKRIDAQIAAALRAFNDAHGALLAIRDQEANQGRPTRPSPE